MKRLLFIIPAFNHGGTNKSLMNILTCIDDQDFVADIFVISHISNVGPYKEKLSSYNILQRDLLLSSIFDRYSDIRIEPIFERLKKLSVRLICRAMQSIIGDRMLDIAYASAARRIDRLQYDTVIAMQEGIATHFASHLRSHKVAWVRCDYSKYFEIANRSELDVYSKFESITCVSEYTKRVFVTHYPSLADKCLAIHNMIDDKSIIKAADDASATEIADASGVFKIVSIGRLNKVKQFEIIPKIAKELKESGSRFMWYIIGDGEERNHILNMIEEHQVSDVVLLLGIRDNPYPYVKMSDLVVCTSVSEACPNVINEGKILHTPVVTTNFGSSIEFIEHGVNGIVASKEDLAAAIGDMIANEQQYSTIKENLSSFVYANDEIKSNVCNLLQLRKNDH